MSLLREAQLQSGVASGEEHQEAESGSSAEGYVEQVNKKPFLLLQLGVKFCFQPGGHRQIYYPSPNMSRPAGQLTEEEQIRIAQRLGLIQHLPSGIYDGSKKNRE